MYEPKYFIESMDFSPVDTGDDTIDDFAEESVIGDITSKIKGKFTKPKNEKPTNVSDKAEAIKKKMADLKAKEDRFNKSYDNMNVTANKFKANVNNNAQYA